MTRRMVRGRTVDPSAGFCRSPSGPETIQSRVKAARHLHSYGSNGLQMPRSPLPQCGHACRRPSVEPNKKRQAQCAICKLTVVIRPSHAGWRIVISPPATESEAEEVEVEVEVEGESAPAPA